VTTLRESKDDKACQYNYKGTDDHIIIMRYYVGKRYGSVIWVFIHVNCIHHPTNKITPRDMWTYWYSIYISLQDLLT
jgi:hypothetical protein